MRSFGSAGVYACASVALSGNARSRILLDSMRCEPEPAIALQTISYQGHASTVPRPPLEGSTSLAAGTPVLLVVFPCLH
jgi:hypothetical protein